MYFLIIVVLTIILAVFAFFYLPEGTLGNKFSPNSNPPNSKSLSLIILTLSVLTLIGGTISQPYVRVWSMGLSGKAQMAEAEANRQIKVREAKATRDAAEKLGEAEVIRAKKLKEANELLSNSFGGPENYLRYLYIEGLKDANANGSAKLIYIATEAGLPVTEAGRVTLGNK